MVEARHGTTDDRDARRLAVVAGEVERIEGILRDYLDRRRPLAALERSEVDVAELGRDVAAVLEARAERSGVTFAGRRAGRSRAGRSAPAQGGAAQPGAQRARNHAGRRAGRRPLAT